MKTFVFSIVMLATVLSSCGNSNNNTKDQSKKNDSEVANTAATNATGQSTVIDETVTAYLQLKNALANDNGKDAAEAGTHLHTALLNLDNVTFTGEQKKVYDDLKDDMKEHAEHISTNADKIAHQREHFDVLSKDMYDLVKSIKPRQPLYKDHCPMYNENKGADWLSEVQEIKNPYLGKKMLDCGEVEEEIKQ